MAAVMVLAARAACAAVAADEVAALPGWVGPLPSRHYSGFLDVGEAGRVRALHYYFIEAQEARSADAPVVMWMNGGPGCSSLDGLFYEHGPLLVAEDGERLVANPYTWARAANVLYLEAPAGVGFSYAEDPADLKTGDNKTAYDNFAALKVFFAKYPEFARNEFYIAGESYGGVYVPTLAYTIFTHRAEMNFNMQGFLVGNGCFGGCEAEGDLPTSPSTEFLAGHGMISRQLYSKTAAACTADRAGKTCADLEAQASSFAAGTNAYDAYRVCYHPPSEEGEAPPSHTRPFSLRRMYTLPRPAHPALGDDVPCIDSTGATIYLARPEVRRALHVDASPNAWQICSDTVDYIEDGVYSSMVPLYQAMSPHWRVLVYNGDVDPGCSYVMNEACVTSVGKPVKEEWREWHYDDAAFGRQVAGYATEYEGDLWFVTIHGAGHMSPQWKPAQAYTMLSRFLARTPF
eukprot:TRINITY_DN6599_c0_g2_i1.p1 TRINITY_DN6599_c0_g2~~TRINITY_DN6599_c0_g2_i1.p1  ORF type:complete len:460 (+),score=166.85 TRINITY_DN6599_c0_g2_i1:68-1447(+)